MSRVCRNVGRKLAFGLNSNGFVERDVLPARLGGICHHQQRSSLARPCTSLDHQILASTESVNRYLLFVSWFVHFAITVLSIQ